jgi:FKBP-type peptidyl-prolyl cis-trans isomerase FkpA
MRKLPVLVLMLAVAGCQNQGSGRSGGGAEAHPQTDEQKAFYALGFALGRDTQVFGMTPEELEYVKAGLTAYVKGQEPVVDVEALGPKIAELARTRLRARAEKEKEKSRPFLETAAKEPGAVRTESGLIFQSLREGTGAQPTASDRVKVNYRASLPDGKEVDSSYKLQKPAQFPLNGIIPCWSEGLQKMKVGGKARLVCPSDLAYGDRGTPSIPGGSAVVYEVELVEVVPKNESAPMPGPHGPHEHGQPARPNPPAPQ